MKKNLEMELISLAKKIISDEKTHLNELKDLAQGLYENLCILAYLEEMENQGTAYKTNSLPSNSSEEEKSDKETDEEDRYAPDGTHYNPEAITEPNTEKIKDIVEQMPPDDSGILERKFDSEDFENELQNLGVHYDDLPQFEPVEKTSTRNTPSNDGQHSEKKEEHQAAGNQKPTNGDKFENKTSVPLIRTETKRSLNDRLKKGVSFGLNDRLVFIKHLFGGNSGDYDRVLSQLNTFQSFESAKNFLETVVKPDYNNWEGEETYEERFLVSLETKMN